MSELSAAITIDADRETVWSVLVDTDAYGEWNPLLECEGPLRPRSRLRVRVKLPGLPAIYTRPRVLSVVENRELRWRTRLPGLRATHGFLLEERTRGSGTRFVQTERFEGSFADRFVSRFGRSSERGFEQMNIGLRRRAERRATEQP